MKSLDCSINVDDRNFPFPVLRSLSELVSAQIVLRHVEDALFKMLHFRNVFLECRILATPMLYSRGRPNEMGLMECIRGEVPPIPIRPRQPPNTLIQFTTQFIYFFWIERELPHFLVLVLSLSHCHVVRDSPGCTSSFRTRACFG